MSNPSVPTKDTSLLSDSETKIVFIHKGDCWYLPYVLYQAKTVSPETDIVLIGDGLIYSGICNENLDNYQSVALQDFKNNYIHMSTNSEEFELFCWLRWFYLLEYMRRNKVPSVLHLDSDVLLYSSIQDIKETFLDGNCSCGLLAPKKEFSLLHWTASGHASYWTIDSLAEFCAFSIDSFTDKKYLELYKVKWQAHVTKAEPGGICDMTTLYLYWYENQDSIQNLLIAKNGAAFDMGVSDASNYVDDEYVTITGRKKITFSKRQSYFHVATDENCMVRAHAIHFQGGAKKYLPKFYTGKYFKGKFTYELPAPLKSAIYKASRVIKKLKTYFYFSSI